MLYSTGNTHLLSAILTQVSGRSTRELFTEWLAEPLGIRVGAWERDPQGVYLGGNNMALSPRALLRFGEMMRNDGIVNEKRVLPPEWIDTSWTPRTRSDSFGRPLRSRLVRHDVQRPRGRLCLGFWRPDALHRARPRAHDRDDVGHRDAVGPHRLRRRAAPPRRRRASSRERRRRSTERAERLSWRAPPSHARLCRRCGGATCRAHDPPRPYPQFRHRRAYRPRQIDARRPADPDDRRAGIARDEGAGARFHGHRARARHHHQGADRPPRLPRAERRGLRAQPHRHARPCRLRLRGEPLARRLRGLAARRRREPGRGGADARQRLPGDRQRPRDRAGPQQDRPARRRAGAHQAADRGRDRPRRLATP